MSDVNEKRLSILQLEYTQSYSRLLYLDGQANNYVNVILTAIAALAAFLSFLIIGDHISNMVFFSILIATATIVIGLLILMTLHHTVQCYRVGGYIKYLEELINSEADADILRWETVITSKYIHKDITSQSIFIVVGILFFVLLGVAAFLAIKYILPVFPLITILVLLIIIMQITSAILYLGKANSVHDKTYKIACSVIHTTDEGAK